MSAKSTTFITQFFSIEHNYFKLFWHQLFPKRLECFFKNTNNNWESLLKFWNNFQIKVLVKICLLWLQKKDLQNFSTVFFNLFSLSTCRRYIICICYSFTPCFLNLEFGIRIVFSEKRSNVPLLSMFFFHMSIDFGRSFHGFIKDFFWISAFCSIYKKSFFSKRKWNCVISCFFF